MGDMVIFHPEGRAEVFTEEGNREDIVIYCDLCNEPLAITTKLGNDEVYLQCLRCHAVNSANLKIQLESEDESIKEI